MCREMQPAHHHQRINLAELKAQIVKKLGPEGSSQYFHVLNRYLSSKLSMVEFNKLCLRIVGRENTPLHNQLIRSILRNACSAKSSPQAHAGNESGLPNGDILRPLPRDVSTGTHHQKATDGSNAKINFVHHKSQAGIHSNSILVSGKGDLTSPDVFRPVQHHQGLLQRAENDGNFSARSQVCAPLGIVLPSASSDGTRRSKPSASSSNHAISLNSGGLLDTSALRKCMEHIAATQGLQGATMDCAKLLNSGLNSYLKGIITSCTNLGRARAGHEVRKSSKHDHQASLKMPNGVKPGYHHVQSSSRPTEGIKEGKSLFNVSLRDFKVAMEVNPQQLGVDWPIFLERTCTNENQE